ncbi:MAG: FMN-binding glutamate synthase family protein [Bacillota bacterium]|jgi:glutamate synthase domain-containing protein 2
MNKKITLGLSAACLGYFGVKWGSRFLINKVFDSALKKVMTDMYDENIWELISAATRIGPQIVIETNLRAQEGKLINRPLGSPKKFPSLDSLMFNIAQLANLPTPIETPVDTSVIIGKQAKKPFKISLPMMVSAMAYGEALTADAKWALAKGASMAKTAICSGEGAFLPQEREAADIYIYMYNRGDWNKDERILQNCSGIEIQFGQGALGGVGHVLHANTIDRELRKALNYPKGKDAIVHSQQLNVQDPADLPKFIEYLKDESGGVPVGVKLAAGKYLEKDLEIVCHAGADYVVLDGAEAGTKGGAPILEDDFGVPTVFAIPRGAEWLYKTGFHKSVSLIASGKIRTPGEVLKAIALGADACYTGTTALFAMTHDQVLKALPYEPPTQVVWYNGKHKGQFKKEKAAQTLAKFFLSCKAEIEVGVKSLGKKTIREVNRDDLFSIDETIARGLKIPMAYERP